MFENEKWIKSQAFLWHFNCISLLIISNFEIFDRPLFWNENEFEKTFQTNFVQLKKVDSEHLLVLISSSNERSYDNFSTDRKKLIIFKAVQFWKTIDKKVGRF